MIDIDVDKNLNLTQGEFIYLILWLFPTWYVWGWASTVLFRTNLCYIGAVAFIGMIGLIGTIYLDLIKK